jgi:crotonobetaine/carnitine-CoA ligase
MSSSFDFHNVRQRTLPALLEHAARSHGAAPFLQEAGSGDWLSHEDAYDAARAVAAGLVRIGVARGDFVPLMAPNCRDFVLSWFGISLLGAAYIAINTSLTGGLLASQFALAKSRVWIVHASFLHVLETLPEGLRAEVHTLVVIGASGEDASPGWCRTIPFSRLLAETPTDLPEVDFTDVAAVMFTSGTTGPSKGVMGTQAQAVTTGQTFASIVGLQARDTLFTPLPLFHGLSSRMGMVPALLTGCRVVLGARFSGSRFWREAAECEATVAHTIFTIPNVLLAQEPGPQDRAHRVTRLFNAHHNPAFESRFGAKLVEALGISEVGLFIASPLAEQCPGSAGRAHPDWEVIVADADGVPLPDGEPGEILCRPKLPGLMMRGYLNLPDRTVEALRDCWYHTGDIARRDADGYFWFLDRAKERIRRRGENVSSWEIEGAVRAHPAIVDVAAVAHPARAGEDDIRLLVVLREGAVLPEPELHDWLRERLPRFMLPRYIEVMPALPYTATSKVEKGKLMAAGLTPQAWDAEAVPAHG